MLLAGCRDKELSFELDLNGLHRGAMTYYLTKEIRETNKSGVTYQEIMQPVAGNVTRENPSQHPQFEGARRSAVVQRPRVRNRERQGGCLRVGLAGRG